MKLKLYDRWLSCEDGRTLEEFVRDYRSAAKGCRQQAKMARQWAPYLAAMQQGMQNVSQPSIQWSQYAQGYRLGGVWGAFNPFSGQRFW